MGPKLVISWGGLASKDAAADWALPRLRANQQVPLARARDAYLGMAADDWSDLLPSAVETAQELLERVQSAG